MKERALFALALTLGTTHCSPAASPDTEAEATATASSDISEPPATTATAETTASTSPATATAVESASASASGSAKVMVGGYSDADPKAANVQTAANKALPLLKTKLSDPSLKLKNVKSAQTQVVAGTNYKLTLELDSKSGPKTVTVVVFQDLKQVYSLTSVEGP